MVPIAILPSARMISRAPSYVLTANGFREDATEDDPMRVMIRRDGPTGFPQLFLLDPDRNIIEINVALTHS